MTTERNYCTLERALDVATMRWVFTARTNIGADHYGVTHVVYQCHWVSLDPEDPSDIDARWVRYDSEGNPYTVPEAITRSLDHEQNKWLKQREDADKEFLSDILSTALEGGINYWADVEQYEPDGTDPFGKIHEEDDGEPRMHCYGWGLSQEKSVPCDGHLVSLETILKGIEFCRIVSPNNYRDHLIQEAVAERDAGHIDANGADIIVQFGLFGDIVYG